MRAPQAVDSEFEDLLIEYSRQSTQDGREAAESRIWTKFGADMSVLVLDMSGFSLLTQRYGVVHYLAMIRRMQLTTLPIVESHQGRVIKFEADNAYAVFPGPLHAARAAIAMNLAFRSSNLLTVDAMDIAISCGIDHGSVLLLGEHDLFGHSVNRASKLGEDVANAGQILITAEAMRQIPPAAEIRGTAVDITVSGINVDAFVINY